MALPDPRRLAAADMWGTRGSLRRRRIIRGEFVVGACGCTLLGILTLLHGSGGWIFLGVWLVGAGANYFPLVIPCHRVVAAGGLGGFANHDDNGYYQKVKRWLLAHEGVPY